MKKMMVLVAALVSSVVFSQRIQEGGSQVNAGLGFSTGWGVPFFAGYDYGLTDDISVGAQMSIASNKENFVDREGQSSSVRERWFGMGVNGNYHFNRVLNIPNKFDLYAGLSLAYNHFNYNNSSYDGEGSGLGFAGQIGARYFFNNQLGVNLEFGGGNVASGGKIGITYKLK